MSRNNQAPGEPRESDEVRRQREFMAYARRHMLDLVLPEERLYELLAKQPLD